MGCLTKQRTEVRTKHQREVGVNEMKTMLQRQSEGVRSPSYQQKP